MLTTQECQIHSTWFLNNVANVKLTDHRSIHKIFHVTDIENLLERENLKEYINDIFLNLINQSNNITDNFLMNINFIVYKIF